jgi:hypothetical protein
MKFMVSLRSWWTSGWWAQLILMALRLLTVRIRAGPCSANGSVELAGLIEGHPR